MGKLRREPSPVHYISNRSIRILKVFRHQDQQLQVVSLREKVREQQACEISRQAVTGCLLSVVLRKAREKYPKQTLLSLSRSVWRVS